MLNLQKAADIMRRELFEPRGLTVPNLPIRWAAPSADGAEAATSYAPILPKFIRVFRGGVNSDPMRAAANLAHEMAHTAAQPYQFPWDDGHPAKWRDAVEAIGLTLEKPWYTVPGPKFVDFYNQHLAGVADA